MKILSITPITEADIELIHDSKEHAKTRIIWLKEQLTNTDYKAIKYAEGLISDIEYETTRLNRIAWRNEINELEQQLKIIESE